MHSHAAEYGEDGEKTEGSEALTHVGNMLIKLYNLHLYKYTENFIQMQEQNVSDIRDKVRSLSTAVWYTLQEIP